MSRRIGLWVLVGIMVACCWVAVGFLASPMYNLGQSTLVAITAPASLFGRKEPLGVIWFILLNGALYGMAGLAVESLRRVHHWSLKSRRAA